MWGNVLEPEASLRTYLQDQGINARLQERKKKYDQSKCRESFYWVGIMFREYTMSGLDKKGRDKDLKAAQTGFTEKMSMPH